MNIGKYIMVYARFVKYRRSVHFGGAFLSCATGGFALFLGLRVAMDVGMSLEKGLIFLTSS